MFESYLAITGKQDPTGKLQREITNLYVHCCSYAHTFNTDNRVQKTITPGYCLFNHVSNHQAPKLKRTTTNNGTLLTVRSDASYEPGDEVCDTYCTPMKIVLPGFPGVILYDDIIPLSCFFGIMETIHAGKEAEFGYRVRDKSVITPDLLQRFHAFYFSQTSLAEDAALLDECTVPLNATAIKLQIIEKSYARSFLDEAHRFLGSTPPPM